jgi:hypothetical protein
MIHWFAAKVDKVAAKTLKLFQKFVRGQAWKSRHECALERAIESRIGLVEESPRYWRRFSHEQNAHMIRPIPSP